MHAGLVISVTLGTVLTGLVTAYAQSPGNFFNPLSGNIPPKIMSFATVPPNGIAPLSVSLSVTALDQDGSIQTVDWDFGDGTQAQTTALSIDHVYMTTGTFIATVSVKDNQGASAVAKTTVTVPAARTPIQQLSALIARVGKSSAPDTSRMLLGAMRGMMEDRSSVACKDLGAFVKDIEDQSGKRVLRSEANELVSSAHLIMQSMRCR
jgi:PKD repeat protein